MTSVARLYRRPVIYGNHTGCRISTVTSGCIDGGNLRSPSSGTTGAHRLWSLRYSFNSATAVPALVSPQDGFNVSSTSAPPGCFLSGRWFWDRSLRGNPYGRATRRRHHRRQSGSVPFPRENGVPFRYTTNTPQESLPSRQRPGSRRRQLQRRHDPGWRRCCSWPNVHRHLSSTNVSISTAVCTVICRSP